MHLPLSEWLTSFPGEVSEMADIEKVIKGLDLCKYDPDPGELVKYIHSCQHCPYWKGGIMNECSVLFTDAISLLKELQQRISEEQT